MPAAPLNREAASGGELRSNPVDDVQPGGNRAAGAFDQSSHLAGRITLQDIRLDRMAACRRTWERGD